MGYKDYLIRYKSNPNIFKDRNVKEDIINNSQKYELTWFCGDKDATSQMIYDLLDDEGMEILFKSKDRLSKVNGIIACGKNIFRLFDNELFLEMLVQLGDYYGYFKGEEAIKFINYVISKYPNMVVKFFGKLSEESKLDVVSHCDMSSFYYDMLRSCDMKSLSYILDRISSLNDAKYSDLLYVFEHASVPQHLFDPKIIKKITTMYNVKMYRNLVDKLICNNDISEIESKRKEFYDFFLSHCMDIYALIKKDVESGLDLMPSLEKYLNCFGGYDSVFKKVFFENISIDEMIDKSFNYITTDIVVDYLFHDFAYNVFVDIKELIAFDSKTHILSNLDENFFLSYFKTRKSDGEPLLFYSKVASLDQMSIDEKIAFLNEYKNIDIVSMFYDNCLLARRKMLELINSSVLNSNTVEKFKNDKLSKKYGVPIYELNGEEFYVFVRSTSVSKREELDKRNLDILCQGVSYSMDGSDKLKLFKEPYEYYSVAYDGIPKDQLVHVFEIDSFSRYRRNSNNVPLNDNGTKRINRLFVPEDIVGGSYSYSELVVSQPDNKDDEFNKALSLPKTFAIYCYDAITDADVESAKANGIGIIVVKTDKYKIDRTDRYGLYGRAQRDLIYFEPNTDDDTWNRKL